MGDEAIHKSLKPINPLGNTLKTCYYSVMKMLSCFWQFIKQHKIIQIFVFPPLLFFSLGYLLYWLVGVIAYTPNFARYVAVNTAVLYFLYKLIAKIIKEKYYCYIKEFCIEFYKFMQYLKQFHATHVFVIPPLSFFVFGYTLLWIFYFIIICKFHPDGSEAPIALLLFVLFLYITIFSFFTALFIEILILIKQVIYKKRIRVTSNFLLNNKIYNIMYVCYIICVITIAIILKVQPEFVIYQGANIFLIPFYYMYQ